MEIAKCLNPMLHALCSMLFASWILNSDSLLLTLCSMPYAFPNSQSEIRNSKFEILKPARCRLPACPEPVEGLPADLYSPKYSLTLANSLSAEKGLVI